MSSILALVDGLFSLMVSAWTGLFSDSILVIFPVGMILLLVVSIVGKSSSGGDSK